MKPATEPAATTALPEIIRTYLAFAGAAKATDPDAVIACFTEDAEVTDFDHVHRGLAQLHRWWEGPVTAYEYTLDVLGGHALGTDRYIVFTRLTGDFPGGTFDQAQRFTLCSGRIARLEIAATTPDDRK